MSGVVSTKPFMAYAVAGHVRCSQIWNGRQCLGSNKSSRFGYESALVSSKYARTSNFQRLNVSRLKSKPSDYAAVDDGLSAFPDRQLLDGALADVPDLQDCQHFLNLTNGIEAMPTLDALDLPYSFCRIQSTACEQQKFEQMMNEVDSALLINLAAGRCVLVWDYGSRNRKRAVPRAIWYGLEFIRFALAKEWLGVEPDAFLRGIKVTKEFSAEVKGFGRSTKRRIRYFRRFLDPNMTQIRLFGVYQATQHDDDVEFYRDIFARHFAEELSEKQLNDKCLRDGQDESGRTNVMAGVERSLLDYSSSRPSAHKSPTVERLHERGFQIFMGGICHKDLRSLIPEKQ